MVGSSHPQMERLSVEDVEAGLRLSGQAGWNQLAEDWLLYLRHGHAVGFQGDDGQIVGTAAAMPYEGGYGYLALVLVTPAWRRQGLGTRMVEHCIKWLEDRHKIPLLDATAAAACGYRRQGFVPMLELDRWEINLPPEVPAKGAAVAASVSDLAKMVELDMQAFGAARPHLLDDIRRRDGTRGIIAPSRDGFAMLRRGRRAAQIGPLIAPDDHVAIALLDTVIAGGGGDIIIDVPKSQTAFGTALEAKGFTRRRSFLRMVRGEPPVPRGPVHLYASTGAEYG